MTSARLQKVQEQLRQRYLERIPNTAQVLESLIEQRQIQAQSAEAEGAILRLAHQIYGSAESFGYPQLGDAARALEAASTEEFASRSELLLSRLRDLMPENQNSRVLLIEDDPSIAELVESLLRGRSVDFVWAKSGEEAREQLEAQDFHLLLLDLVLPDCDGRDLLAHLRTLPRLRDQSVIILSGKKTSPLVRNECALYGIDDFIIKPIDKANFASRVGFAMDRSRTLSEIYKDPLTQLDNRLGFYRTYEASLALCRRNEEPMSVAILDLDHFKWLNDNHGHMEGDRVLVLLAQLFREQLRGSDIYARWGGEEFLLALPQTSKQGASQVLSRIARSFEEQTRERSHGAVTFSGGIVEVAHKESLEMALLRADQLLYQAKEMGRARCIYEQELRQEHQHQLLVAEDDPLVAAALLQLLRTKYRLLYAKDGREVLELALEREDIDLLLLDHQMPHLTGLDVLKQLRKTKRYQKKPIVMLTVMGDEALLEEAFDSGASDYVLKPYQERVLLARIKRFLAPCAEP